MSEPAGPPKKKNKDALGHQTKRDLLGSARQRALAERCEGLP